MNIFVCYSWLFLNGSVSQFVLVSVCQTLQSRVTYLSNHLRGFPWHFVKTIFVPRWWIVIILSREAPLSHLCFHDLCRFSVLHNNISAQQSSHSCCKQLPPACTHSLISWCKRCDKQTLLFAVKPGHTERTQHTTCAKKTKHTLHEKRSLMQLSSDDKAIATYMHWYTLIMDIC